jgi:hypothetical protein
MHFYQKSDGLHEKVWEFVSIEITRVWHFFNAYVNSENIKEKHTRVSFDDMFRRCMMTLPGSLKQNWTIRSTVMNQLGLYQRNSFNARRV